MTRPDTRSWSLEEIEVSLNNATRAASNLDIAYFWACRADYHYRHSNNTLAEIDATHAIELATASDDKEILGYAMSIKASVLAFRADPDAENYYLRTFDLLSQSGNVYQEASHRIGYGNLLSKQGRSEDAIGQYERSKELYKASGHSDQQVRPMIGIGCIYYNAGESLRAIEIWKDAAELARRTRQLQHEFTALYDIGAAYVEIRNEELGELFVKRAYDVSLKLGNPTETAHCHSLFASIHFMRKNIELALKEFQLCHSVYLQAGDSFNAAQARISVGDSLFELGRYEDAIQELKKSEEELTALNGKSVLAKVYAALVESYQQKEEYKNAFDYYKRQVALQEEIRSIDLRTRLHSLERKLEKERAETETKLYQMRAQQLEEKLAVQTMAYATKTEILAKFRDELREITRTAYDPVEALKKITARLKELPNPDIDWSKFEKEFLEAHPGFRVVLAEQFPALTKQELRLCQLLRTGLKSHEAARLMCITERGVEQHRLRVRRKLGLKGKESLTEFLAGLS